VVRLKTSIQNELGGETTVTESPRTPGYPYRYTAPEKLREDAQETLEKFEIHGDHSTTVPVRTAKPEDGELINDRGKRSPIK
jgi:hypothetical protein